MEFSRQEYGSGLSFPSPGDLPNPEIEPGSPALQADCSQLSYKGVEGSFFSHPLQHLLFVDSFDDGHSGPCDVIPPL